MERWVKAIQKDEKSLVSSVFCDAISLVCNKLNFFSIFVWN